MEKETILKILLNNKYYTIDDLRYNKNVGLFFSKKDLADFLEGKDDLISEGNDNLVKIPLKTFNSKHLFFTSGTYLNFNKKEYLSTLIKDFEENREFLASRNFEQIFLSRIFSEVEGTLNIENVPTTRKRIQEVFNSENLSDKNDIIIKTVLRTKQT